MPPSSRFVYILDVAQFTAALIIVMVLGSFDYKPALGVLTFGVISHGP